MTNHEMSSYPITDVPTEYSDDNTEGNPLNVVYRRVPKKSIWDLELDAPDTIQDPKRKQLRLRLETLLSGSTISGISQAFSDRKGLYKTFWIVLFALGVVGFAVNFYFVIAHFLERPILTQLRRTTQSFQWPHLTFCNPSNPIPFWKSDELYYEWNATFQRAHHYKLPKYLDKKIWEHYVALSTINPAKFYRFSPMDMIFRVTVVYKEATIASSSSSLDRFHIVTDIKEMYQSHLESFRASIPCVTIKPEKILESLKINENLAAIKVYLLMDFRSYSIYNSGYESRKLYFFINNAHHTPQSSFPHHILSGTTSFFTLKQRIHERITDCTSEIFPVQLYDVDMNGVSYFDGTYEDCRTFLSQHLFVERCGCYNSNLPLYKFSDHLPRVCTNMSIFNEDQMRENIDCLNKVMEEDANSHKFKYELSIHCSRFSQLPCKSSTYFLSRNTNYWQDDMNAERQATQIAASKLLPNGKQNGTAEFPAENVTRSFARKNMAIINIIASKEAPEATYEEYEYPLPQFLSDFGGAIGLWIGLSVISIFEIMELIVVLMKYLKRTYQSPAF